MCGGKMLKCKQEAYPCVAHEKGLQKSLVDMSAVTSLAYTLSHVPLHYENEKTICQKGSSLPALLR